MELPTQEERIKKFMESLSNSPTFSGWTWLTPDTKDFKVGVGPDTFCTKV